MDKIPITFDHNGKHFDCRFNKVSGAGDSSTFHLMDNRNFYLGRLRRHKDQWVFDESKPENKLSELADYFGDYLTAWYQ